MLDFEKRPSHGHAAVAASYMVDAATLQALKRWRFPRYIDARCAYAAAPHVPRCRVKPGFSSCFGGHIFARLTPLYSIFITV